MLKITTVNKGAELVSVIHDDIEKIHDGENDWNRHAPVLFPIVGKVKDGKTIIDGNGVFASLALKNGFTIYTESDIENIIKKNG